MLMSIKWKIKFLRNSAFRAVAVFCGRRIGKVVVDEDRLRHLCSWRFCMSYNDSYFGEPEGLLKAIVADMDRELPLQRNGSNIPAELVDA